MNVLLALLLLLGVVSNEVSSRQIPHRKIHSHAQRGVFKTIGTFLNRLSLPTKRNLNIFDDRVVKNIHFLASENDWLKKTKSTPGKRCANLLDESCSNGEVPGAGADSDWINGGYTPGKRSFNLLDDHNAPFSAQNDIITPGKRCANLLDESCSNGDISGAAADDDWINGGNSPGKRSLNLMDDRNYPFRPQDNIITPGKRCANLLDESCGNGGVPGAGTDSDWISGGYSPGKRSFNLLDDHNAPFSPQNDIITPGKRCANLLDESCSNGDISGAAADNDWINGGNSPGKRSLNLMDDRNYPFRPQDNIITPGKRCANLLDESCGNGGVPGAGTDSDWISGGYSPGKRSLNLLDDHNAPFSPQNDIITPGKRSWNFIDDHNAPFVPQSNVVNPGKRCANLLDKSCINGAVSSAAVDSDWIREYFLGKRALNLMDDRHLPTRPQDKIATPGKRCSNLRDENCKNGGAPGTDDDDWINGGDTHVKRSWNFIDDHNSPFVPQNNVVNPGKRCASLFDEKCNDGNMPETVGNID